MDVAVDAVPGTVPAALQKASPEVAFAAGEEPKSGGAAAEPVTVSTVSARPAKLVAFDGKAGEDKKQWVEGYFDSIAARYGATPAILCRSCGRAHPFCMRPQPPPQMPQPYPPPLPSQMHRLASQITT